MIQEPKKSSRENDRVIGNFGLKDWEICGVPLFGRTRVLLLDILAKDKLKTPVWIATVNPEFVMNARKDVEFMKILQNRTTINVVDGIGLAWAKKVKSQKSKVKKLMVGFSEGVKVLMGKYGDEVITGVDLVDDLCRLAQAKGKTVFFYGGWDDRSQRTAEYFLRKYPKLKVVGAQAEDYDFETSVDFLFVCRAMKKQELWINDHFDKLRVELVIGLGRTFDYYSGELPRAPRWMQKMGLEWLYSLFTDKGRRKRKFELLKFMFMVLFGK
ncbi:MAG: WecB/TagA/CpsF family glycosyltransferase [Microgenomates group bacterium]